jgi:hypothetical protein
MLGHCVIERLGLCKHRHPFVDVIEKSRCIGFLCEWLHIDLCCDIGALSDEARDLLVKLLCDLDKTPTVNLTKPLKISELTSQLEKSTHDFLNFILVQGSYNVGGSSISVLEEVQPAAELCEFLVVEKVDIFEVSIKSEKEFCVGS